MPQSTRSILIAVGALVVAAMSLVSPLPAGAVAGGGSLALSADGNAFTATWAGSTLSNSVDLEMFPLGHTCAGADAQTSSTYFMTSWPSGPAVTLLSASPQSFTYGSTIAEYRSSTWQATTIAAGSYTVCLIGVVSGVRSVLDTVDLTIVDPATTTTTTTTAAAEAPAAPSFTG